jgi:hypothetical protein
MSDERKKFEKSEPVVTKTWEQLLNEVIEFKSMHGRLPKHKCQCYSWLKRNRINYRKGILTDEQRILFEENDLVGPNAWGVGIVTKTWEQRLNEVVEFKKLHNRLPEHGRNYHWLRANLTLYREALLPEYQCTELEENGLIDPNEWGVKDPKRNTTRFHAIQLSCCCAPSTVHEPSNET